MVATLIRNDGGSLVDPECGGKVLGEFTVAVLVFSAGAAGACLVSADLASFADKWLMARLGSGGLISCSGHTGLVVAELPL